MVATWTMSASRARTDFIFLEKQHARLRSRPTIFSRVRLFVCGRVADVSSSSAVTYPATRRADCIDRAQLERIVVGLRRGASGGYNFNQSPHSNDTLSRQHHPYRDCLARVPDPHQPVDSLL